MDTKTKCARGVPDEPEAGRPQAPVIVPASSFAMQDQTEVEQYFETGRGYLYSRYGNPTVRRTERFLADLEGADDAALFASGMAAISTTVLALAGSGDRVAVQSEVYGGTAELFRTVLPALGLDVFWLTRERIGELQPRHVEGCRLIFLETPINPTLRLINLPRAAHVAREAGALCVVDATFGTPILQRPLECGVDLVVHSATKYLGGHDDLIGGAVVGADASIRRVVERRKALGGIMNPFTAFLLYRGMRTLAVRVEAQCLGAETVARALAAHPRVSAVHYPGLPEHPDHELARKQMKGFGGMVSFEVEGGPDEAERVHDALELFVRAPSLGGVGSLVSIPARMSHRSVDAAARRRAGVGPNLLRLSVGLESPRDLVADLEQALARP